MKPGLNKILAVQFKYFGDAVLMTPALRVLREHLGAGQLHVLVAEDTAPLLEHLKWIDRVWAMPRKRGKAGLRRSWPVIQALRRERFDASVDFASNDRGALVSLMVGAPHRLGWDQPGGFWGRRWIYTDRVPLPPEEVHESLRLEKLLEGWGIKSQGRFPVEIQPDPALAAKAAEIVPVGNVVLCHMASSQPKKEWPPSHWQDFHRLATAAGYHLLYTTARGGRERELMADYLKRVPEAQILPEMPDLALFLAVLSRSQAFVSADTGPLHFAAGLRLPTVSLFGPSASSRWAPLGPRHRALAAGQCVCDVHDAICKAQGHCMARLAPEKVLLALNELLRAGRTQG